jgi:mycothiol system anti-sigma-R factor
MDCKAKTPLLHAYLDDELDRDAVDELERHLEQCEECTRELSSMQVLRKVVKEGAPRYSAPASLRAKLQGADAESKPRSEPAATRFAPRWAMAASFLVAFALGGLSMRLYGNLSAPTTGRQVFVHDLLSSHLRALASTNPVDVISTNRHTVKPWFAGKIAQSPPVLDLAADGFPLVGGRIDYIDGQRVAVLVYGHGQHLIDVYVSPASTDELEQMPRVIDGYRIAAIRVQDQPVWVVGDIDEQEFGRFKGLLSAGVSRQ